jgi:rhamnosyltransferase
MLHQLAVNPAVTLVLNNANLGIASALNIGIRRARTHKWVLLLDQDSVIDDDMVHTLITVQTAFPDLDRLALIGSAFRVNDTEEAPHDPISSDNTWEEAESVITSGSLVSLKAYDIIGPFREEFFIDYVDTEYCFRARAKGFRVIRTQKRIMVHSVGAITRHRVLWFKKWTFNHGADRRYYIARNDTILLREYGSFAPGIWALKSFGRSVRLCKRITLYEEQKFQKILAVAQGWWHGVRGQMGPRPRRHPKHNFRAR